MRLVASHVYAEGAPPGFSGGFKEESCHACHFHSEPNSGPGRVAIEGVPARFTAGERYTLIVTLTQAGMKRAGFQVTSRFKDTGAQAGTLAPAPDDRNRIGIDVRGGVQYAGQRKPGASVTASEAVRWTIQWTAPDAGGPVVFNVAANAADGNESADGDFVYTTTAESASSGALTLQLAKLRLNRGTLDSLYLASTRSTLITLVDCQFATADAHARHQPRAATRLSRPSVRAAGVRSLVPTNCAA